MEEFESLLATLTRIESSSDDEERLKLREVEERLIAMVSRMSLRPMMVRCLLKALRKAEAEAVMEVVAKTIAACSGVCAAPPALRTFHFSPTLTLQIHEMDYIQGGLGWKVWGAALVLSWRLLALKDVICGKTVLEVGSGCGLCGLLIANLCAAKVVLTDNVLDILLNLSKNASLLSIKGHGKLKKQFVSKQQKHIVDFEQRPQEDHIADYIHVSSNPEEATCSCLVSIRKLDWIEDSTMASQDSPIEIQALEVFPRLAVDEKFDWIVGSDLLYDQQSLLALVHVIHHRLLKYDSKALIVSTIREKEMLDQFLKEIDDLGMSSQVEQVDEQEWNNCKLASCALGGKDNIEEDGTMYDITHYEWGMVAIYITLNINS